MTDQPTPRRWTPAELDAVETTDEVAITSHRPDGSLRPFVTIWAVRVDDGVYVRSAYGPDNGWFARATAAGTGALRVGGTVTGVRFEVPAPTVHDAIDAAYHLAYDRHGPQIVGTVVGPAVREVTLRLVPTA
jgi:hypothetical protein